jgi:signal peptidase II
LSPAVEGWRKALALCGGVVVLDQCTKGLVESTISRGERIHVLPGLVFENTRNRGIAFGLFGDVSPLLIALTVVALVALLAFLAAQTSRPLMWIPTGLLVGGALSNLADRVRIDSVIDFIDLPAWPTFNLADVAITAGVIALVLVAERRPHEPRSEA